MKLITPFFIQKSNLFIYFKKKPANLTLNEFFDKFGGRVRSQLVKLTEFQ